ncbi:ABC1 kinase family protein [Luteipulveratus halotolerans]|uniref:ABC1 atypical kinase-like domain-containing protein n=1 Tax=Luteipulveratus halotolerans TaxID=1631356 RepID=A0A0L6CPB5_9MICO|nr:AarF/ABC1/UbiB kinase family protein [Luteipulveratus halotolerans]KNX39572.1 hypothetical protein VV01_17830 [Luteipulveratus halotolerans]
MPTPRTRRSRTGRTAQLAGVAGGQATRQLSTRTANVFRSDEAAAAALEARSIEMADRLLTVLGTMKGAALKFGQMLAMVDGGLVPESHREQFQSRLAALHANAPTVPWDRMRRQIESELGERLASAYKDFDETPVAAASIGQVYRAVLRDGREVAVKVQYPGIDTAVRGDLKNLALFLKVAGRTMRSPLDATALAAEVEARIVDELDYVLEADHTRAMSRVFRGHPFIRVPAVVSDLSTTRVLTTTWLDGVPLRSVADADPDTRRRTAEILYRFYGLTPHRNGIYNADPHPGNCLVMADGTLAFLDFGLLGRLSLHDSAAERATLRAVIEGDAEALARLSYERGFLSDPSAVDADDLLSMMRSVCWWFCEDREVEISSAAVNELPAQMATPRASLALAQQFSMPSTYAFRARAEGQIPGLLSTLRPTINLHRVAREWVYDEPPVTGLGRVERAWAMEAGHAAPAS